MVEEQSSLYNFFFADFCRTTINALVFIGLILLIIILHKAYTIKNEKFSFVFIIMINVMICAILSIIGYIFNWQIYFDDSSHKLLFGEVDGFLCRFQTFILGYFQTTRESLLTSLTIVIFCDYHEINIEEKKIFKYFIFILSYGIPLISNIIFLSIGGYGEMDLFCFTNSETIGKISVFLHLLYLILLILSNIVLVIIIVVKDKKQDNSNQDWLNETDSIKGFQDSSVQKIAFYPIAQIICLILPITYRIGNSFGIVKTNLILAQITAIGNSLSSVLYALIFLITNRMTFAKAKKKKDEIEKPINSSTNCYELSKDI